MSSGMPRNNKSCFKIRVALTNAIMFAGRTLHAGRLNVNVRQI